MSQPIYRPDIDGLRAVAVSLVVIYHAFPTTLTGGFVGVDVFFVISGFLISTIIQTQLEAGRFSFRDFYARRIRRIFPALLLILPLCLAYGYLVLLPSELAQLGKDTAGGAGFIANLILWQEAGYFDRASVTKPLLHLWSLGIEEQFYIVWPIALWSLHRLRWRPTGFILSVGALSFSLNLATAAGHPTADFYSPLTRFWELAAGALLTRVRPPAMPNALSVAGALLIVGAAVGVDQSTPFPGWRALLPTLGAMALIAAGPAALINRRLLSHRVAVSIGLISYPLYLWHWPLLSFATIEQVIRPRLTAPALLLMALSLLLAWLTYRLIERPIRFATRPGKTLPLAGAMALIAAAGLLTWWANGFPARYHNLAGVDIAKINAADHDGIFQPTPGMQLHTVDGITIADIGAGDDSVLFTGDSVVFQYGPRIQRLLDQGRLKKHVIFVVGASCSPIPGIIKPGNFAYCRAMPALAERIARDQHIKTIIIGAFWRSYTGTDVIVERAGVRQPIDSPAALDAVYANLADDVARLEQSAHRVFLILPAPNDYRFNPAAMISRSLTSFTIDETAIKGPPLADLIAVSADVDRRLTDIAHQTGAATLDPFPNVCGPGPLCSSVFNGDEPKFSDVTHLRPLFVRDHITFLDALLTE